MFFLMLHSKCLQRFSSHLSPQDLVALTRGEHERQEAVQEL
jgi:hypothetical protein